MTTKTKGRNGGNRATQESFHKRHYTAVTPLLKTATANEPNPDLLRFVRQVDLAIYEVAR